MSDFRAIGGVSASLKALLEDRMELPELPGGRTNVPVTISTPGSERQDGQEDGQDTSTPRVNLFLYRITENGNLKNQEIPGHGVAGAYGHPPLSLDLHYVLTAYGTTTTRPEDPVDEKVAHELLGSAMRVFHDHPVITEQLVTIKDPAGRQVLDQGLTGEFEQVKLSLDPISLEDLSKVWTSLMLSYRLSVAYKVTVVQIESQRARRFPRPVGEPPSGGPRIHVVPFRSPQIRELRVRRGDPSVAESPFPHARVGDTLVVQGRNFGRESVEVRLGDLMIPVTPQSDDRIELGIPDATLPDGAVIPEERRLQPGAHPVSVVLGVPELPQTGFRSNQAVFMLVPLIDGLQSNLNATPRTLRITGRRLFLENLSSEMLVGPALIGKDSYRDPSPTRITVPLPDTLPARRVRCLVSGNLSPFPTNLPGPMEVQVKIGDDGPRTATLAERPRALEGATGILQAAIRSAPGGGAAFKGAWVTTAGNRLIVMPGGLFDAVTISGPLARALELFPVPPNPNPRAERVEAYLSGELAPFPALTAARPSLRVTMGNETRTATLASRPTTLADAAAKLRTAIQTARSPGDGGQAPPGFSRAQVTVLGNQLLILPGASVQTNFESVPDGDQTTVAELRLRARYLVRMRVNGVESIDDEGVEMP